jgi:hypothetical protein
MNLKDFGKQVDNHDVWPQDVPAENLRIQVDIGGFELDIVGIRGDDGQVLIDVLQPKPLDATTCLFNLWIDYIAEAREQELHVDLTPEERVEDFLVYLREVKALTKEEPDEAGTSQEASAAKG